MSQSNMRKKAGSRVAVSVDDVFSGITMIGKPGRGRRSRTASEVAAQTEGATIVGEPGHELIVDPLDKQADRP